MQCTIAIEPFLGLKLAFVPRPLPCHFLPGRRESPFPEAEGNEARSSLRNLLRLVNDYLLNFTFDVRPRGPSMLRE